MGTNKKLKAYVRFDGSGRIVPSSVILQRNKPKVGNWKEIDANECCNYTPPIGPFNFDVTANWKAVSPVVKNADTFKTFLENGQDNVGNVNNLTGVKVTDFLLVGNRLRCNVSSTGGDSLGLAYMDVTDVTSLGNLQITGYLYLYGNSIPSVDNTIWPTGLTSIDLGDNNILSFDNVIWPTTLIGYLSLYSNPLISFKPVIPLSNTITAINLSGCQLTIVDDIIWPSELQTLDLSYNQIATFDPSIALPSGLQVLYLVNNQLTSFDPSIALPNSLTYLYLESNQIVTFNPSIALPNSLLELTLSNNNMTTAGYTASEPWANAMSTTPAGSYIYFNSNVNSVSGTNLETILIAKGWNVIS